MTRKSGTPNSTTPGTALATTVHFHGEPSVDVVTRIYGDTIPFFDARDAAMEAANTSEVVSEQHSLRLDELTGDAITAGCN